MTSAIYNEVLQFFLIVFGFAPLVFLGLQDIGGWDGSATRAHAGCYIAQASRRMHGRSSWSHFGDPNANPMGVEWFGLSMGLGFVLVLRLLVHGFPGRTARDGRELDVSRAAHSDHRGRAEDAVPLSRDSAGHDRDRVDVSAHGETGFSLPQKADGTFNYDLAMPMMVFHYFPTGLLGSALRRCWRASCRAWPAMSRHSIRCGRTTSTSPTSIAAAAIEHYLWMGRVSDRRRHRTVRCDGVCGDAFNNIMDLLQLVFAFVNAPLFGTFLLGMFWKRATGHGAFIGLAGGTAAAAIHHGLSLAKGGCRRA